MVTLLKVFAYFFWVLGGIMGCFVLCCYHKIKLVIAIIKTTSEFMAETLTVLFVPIINTFISGCFAAIWIVGTIYLFSVGEVKPRANLPLSQIIWNDNTRRAWYFNLFAVLWIIAFILSLGNFVIGAACCIWYFNQNAEGDTTEKGKSRVSRAYWWAFRYHLGSIAFGSLILAFVWAIRLIFEYIYHQVSQNKTVSENRFIKIALNLVRCCLACFERIVRFINKQAFIQIGLTGKHFCAAAKDGFCVVISHPIEFGLLSGLAHIFMLLGNALMVGGTMCIAFLIMRKVSSINDTISSPFWPLLVHCSYPAHRRRLLPRG